MIITTARKPSSKTRTFCRHLSRFTGWEYINRGKSSLSAFADEPFLLIGESKGNPWSFNFFIDGRCILSIHANVSLLKETKPGQEPIIEGNTPLALALSKVTGLRIGGSSERVIRVDDSIGFLDRDVPYIVLKVLERRGEVIV
ncbi:hypothetical protein ANME2D_02744 [Candidatus Methanoperedens nitroreducens]|uniref:Brix domain-containing ribosomal biogenesis protein n=1 Tax=Candidatus Methanoperedens nitratireducens TaxID=1392998 RepID=A0A062V5N7_9EURY|nr:hypothetical protein [Candidatus Methanoperedens nitroreducens]KCZ70720.1 hypothetical protein ANME2D_02744 [Candidatus Methanoperedens nitroreducens]MDJ1420575.1 hypothetical protein [Candidatus Methanoperedens sp.]